MKRTMGRPAKPEIERFEITREQHDFALGRVDFLASRPMTTRSLTDLLANAYVLGLQDAAEWMATDKPGTEA